MSLHDYHLVCSIYTSEHSVNIRAYSSKFGFRKNWISVTSRHFTSLHDYHVVCSIHTSEHSVNIRTNSAFGKIRPSDNFWFRTYATLHCLYEIRNFYNFSYTMSIKIAQELLTNVSAIDPKVRLQMATSVCVSNFTLIKCRLKLKAQENLQTCQLYRSRSPASNSNECFCVRLRIDETLIKIESSSNITNVSAIDPKVRLQMATSVCVFDFK